VWLPGSTDRGRHLSAAEKHELAVGFDSRQGEREGVLAVKLRRNGTKKTRFFKNEPEKLLKIRGRDQKRAENEPKRT
jgi:hypothetical protein